MRGGVTLPIPPVEEDDMEFVIVVPGDGNDADKYDNHDNKAEDSGNDCKPAAPPPLGSGICIGHHNDENSNNDSNCEETTTTTLTAMTSKDSWDAARGGSHAPSASRRCPTSRL